MTKLDRRLFLLGSAAFVMGRDLRAEPLTWSEAPPIARPVPMDDVLSKGGLSAQIRFLARTADGTVLAARGADEGCPPASTLKIVTALFALDKLGPEHRFATRVLRSGDTLVLAGGGDPVLDSDKLADLARRLAMLHPEGIGRFVVWGGALPRLAEIAPGQAEHLAYNPSISGVMLNFNRVEMSWKCQPDCRLEVLAAGGENKPKAWTVSAGLGEGQIRHESTSSGEHWSVPRRMLGAAGRRWLPVRRPELYAGDVFQTLCRAHGLVLPNPEVVDDLPHGQELVRVESAALSDILSGMLEYSTNLTAEAVGLAASGAPDLSRSSARMQKWAEDHGAEGVIFADHSGLSADSRITPRAMVSLLEGVGQRFDLAGILKKGAVWPKTATGWGEGVIAAKTGTLNFVSNFAGYLSVGVKPASFAIFCMDEDRHVATSGRDLPAGVIGWTEDAKKLQQRLLDHWAQALYRDTREGLRGALPEGAG